MSKQAKNHELFEITHWQQAGKPSSFKYSSTLTQTVAKAGVVLSCKKWDVPYLLKWQRTTRFMCLSGELPDFHNYTASFS